MEKGSRSKTDIRLSLFESASFPNGPYIFHFNDPGDARFEIYIRESRPVSIGKPCFRLIVLFILVVIKKKKEREKVEAVCEARCIFTIPPRSDRQLHLLPI